MAEKAEPRMELPELKSAVWQVSEVTGGIDAVLEVAQAGGTWEGLAYTTTGAEAVKEVHKGQLVSTQSVTVEKNTVYELRLWEVKASQAQARELRWVNGNGAVEIIVYEGSSDSNDGLGDSCWTVPNCYLQHDSTESTKPKVMTTVEVFVEEKYGNIVFADELYTGSWGENE